MHFFLSLELTRYLYIPKLRYLINLDQVRQKKKEYEEDNIFRMCIKQ